jgi:Spy/CpxP family protein refolding chaperone
MLKTLLVAGCLAAAPLCAQEMDHSQCLDGPAASAQTMDHSKMDHSQHQHTMDQSPYVDRKSLPIKALTPDTLDAYRDGTGGGMAVAAELNGYPGPRHILDLADQLNLDAGQKTKVKAIYDHMHEAAVKIGQDIIDREKKLDDAFSHGTANDAQVRSLTAEIANLQGTLRYTHLAAHVAAKSLLTAEQIKRYNEARGY